jgi:EAL domain-containing protein (putative c-di-GMP-specific phosphodiesterase class I)
MHELQSVQGILSHVKGLGVRISLDDFGTGYSSLSYLNKLPIDYLKIDRSFISDLQINHSDKSIAHGIIQLGKALNMPVIAEGVETKKQLDVLLNWGCQYIQGYYFAQPMTATNLLQFLQKHDSKQWQLAGDATGL